MSVEWKREKEGNMTVIEIYTLEENKRTINVKYDNDNRPQHRIVCHQKSRQL